MKFLVTALARMVFFNLSKWASLLKLKDSPLSECTVALYENSNGEWNRSLQPRKQGWDYSKAPVGAKRKKHAKIIVPSYTVLSIVALANSFEALIFNNRCNKINVKFILRIEAFRVRDKGMIHILRECFIGGLSTTV